MSKAPRRPPGNQRPIVYVVNHIHIAAPARIVVRLAGRVEDWPRILAHYRKVDVRAVRTEGRIVEMSAVRRGVPVPVRWRALQRVEALDSRVLYRHIGGVTRGMLVEWRIVPANEGVDVTIIHDFAPNWPWPGPLIARYIVGAFFVHSIADATLAGIKAQAELIVASTGDEPETG